MPLETHATTATATAAPTTGIERVLFLYNAAFPPLVFLVCLYVGLADAVFGLSRVVGRRLHPRLRAATRAGYVGLNTLIAGVLNGMLWVHCGTDDACAEQPLHRRTCLLAASLALLGILAARALDRVAVPLLRVHARQTGPLSLAAYETRLRARVVHGAVACVAWMCMAEAETLGIVLMLATTSRRALAPLAPAFAVVYVSTMRLYALLHTSWVLNNDCAVAGTKRMPVAVLVTLLFV